MGARLHCLSVHLFKHNLNFALLFKKYYYGLFEFCITHYHSHYMRRCILFKGGFSDTCALAFVKYNLILVLRRKVKIIFRHFLLISCTIY